MPAKKRTEQSKGTPSTSPTTSTTHASAEQSHRLRHAGPSISTRSGSSATSSKQAARTHPEPTHESPPILGTHHEKKRLAEVPAPGARTTFIKFLYVLLFVVLLLFTWYLYGMITLLEKLKEEVGWWGIVTGDYSGGAIRWEAAEAWGNGPDRRRGGAAAEKGGGLEGSLNALADALGIPPVQVASAVKPLVPQATLTSIASKVGPTGDSEAVKILFEDTM